MRWSVYILECCDGTLYTGVTNNLRRRLEEHNNGRGAKYTRGRAPVKLIWSEPHARKGDALRREMSIKKLSRSDKIAIARGVSRGGQGGEPNEANDPSSAA